LRIVVACDVERRGVKVIRIGVKDFECIGETPLKTILMSIWNSASKSRFCVDDLSARARISVMDDIPWYSEAVLSGDGHFHRAGTLIQCVRKWALLPEAERKTAQLKLSFDLEGCRTVDGEEIGRLTTLTGFSKA
jgi:hypothetical protein